MGKLLLIAMVFFTSCKVEGHPWPWPFPVPHPPPQEPIPAPPLPPGTPTPPSTQEGLKILINQARMARGLPVLVSTTALDCSAVIHAVDMEDNSLCSHNGSDNSRFWERAKKCGTRASGEVLGCGHQDEESLVRDWINDPAHAAILFDKKQIAMGAGRVGDYWVVVFMK